MNIIAKSLKSDGGATIALRRMFQLPTTIGRSYLTSVASVAAAFVVAAILGGIFALHWSTLLLFFAAVVISATYGGFGPAILAAVLGYAAESWLIIALDKHPFDFEFPMYVVRGAVFLLISVFTTSLIVSIQAARLKAMRKTDALLRVIREADVRKDAFLSTVAHELRNPLAAISNAVELSSHVQTSPQQTDKLREIVRRQVCHMSRLIEDLMDIRRIAHGDLEQRMQPLQLQDVLTHAVEEIRPVLDGFEHRFEVSMPDEPLSILGDPDRLRQVFGNILHNAAKYTPKGGRITLSAGLDNGLIVVRIRDNGVGIPLDMLSRIFTPFTQIENTMSQRCGGVGIGLALVKQLVELNAGRVEAHSNGPGTGSEFVVSLPYYDPSLHEQVVWAFKKRPGSRPPTERKSIVVAEDCDDEASLIAGMLETLGYRVVVAHDGASAVDAVNAAHSNIAIMDLNMPKMDGYEAARRLRAQPSTKSMKLIAMTGFQPKDNYSRARDAGFDRYLSKPIATKMLEFLLGEITENEPKSSAKGSTTTAVTNGGSN